MLTCSSALKAFIAKVGHIKLLMFVSRWAFYSLWCRDALWW